MQSLSGIFWFIFFLQRFSGIVVIKLPFIKTVLKRCIYDLLILKMYPSDGIL